MTHRSRLVIAVTLVSAIIAAEDAGAAITRLSAADFATAAAGREVVEDFEGFTPGVQANPFIFSNARYSSPSAPAVVNSAGFGPTNRLIT